MFERFTEPARRALFFARYEATQSGRRAITVEHLLLGVMRDTRGVARNTLDLAHLSAEAVRAAIDQRTKAGGADSPSESTPVTVEIPFTDETKRALQLAAREADQLGHVQIGTEHLLLAILNLTQSTAASILTNAGLDLDTARKQVAAGRASVPRPGSHVGRSARPFERGTSSTRDMTTWSLEGFFIRPLLGKVYDMAETRIDLPAELDTNERYDASVTIAADPSVAGSHESYERLAREMERAIQDQFSINVTRATREMDVYVLTAPQGLRAPKESDFEGGGLFSTSGGVFEPVIDPRLPEDAQNQQALEQMKARFEALLRGARGGSRPIGSLSGSGGMAGICAMLEPHLGRPVIDETGLVGSYRVDVRAETTTTEGFIQALRDQLGLAATPARRVVTSLVVTARG